MFGNSGHTGGGFLARVRRRWRARRAARGTRPDELLSRALLAALEPMELDEAEALLTELLKDDSQSVLAFLALARLYRRRGEVGRSIRVHQNLLLRQDLAESTRVRVLAELAEDFRKGGFLDRALASFEEVVAHDARHVVARRTLVGLRADLGDFEGALRDLRVLGRLEGRADPRREAELRVGAAKTAHAAGRDDMARKAVKRALKKDAANAEAGILLGRLEAEKGRDKAALAAWQRVLEHGAPPVGDKEEADLYSMVEASFAALNRTRDYEVFLRDLMTKRPGDTSATLALVRTLVARGDRDRAIAELRDALARAPQNLELRIHFARALMAASRDSEALTELGVLLSQLEDRPELLKRESLS